jgi:hypothetical protein
MSDVSPEVTRALILRQIDQYKNSIEDLRIQNVVAQSLGDTEEQRKPIRDQMTRCEKAKAKLQAMLGELPKPDVV